ncbi:MAG: hypothetical protein AAF441_21460 [Pseudomonadota bacterium]
MMFASLKAVVGQGFAILFAAGVILSAQSLPANAEMPCGPHDKIKAALEKKYNELRKGIGLVSNKNVAEVYVSESGSWTFIVTYLNGMSCVVATGHSWEDAPRVASVKPGI